MNKRSERKEECMNVSLLLSPKLADNLKHVWLVDTSDQRWDEIILLSMIVFLFHENFKAPFSASDSHPGNRTIFGFKRSLLQRFPSSIKYILAILHLLISVFIQSTQVFFGRPLPPTLFNFKIHHNIVAIFLFKNSTISLFSL